MAQLQPTAVHPRGQLSIPRPRGTSDAIAQQRVGLLLPDKDSTTPRDQGSKASAVSVTIATIESKRIDAPLSPRTFWPSPVYK